MGRSSLSPGSSSVIGQLQTSISILNKKITIMNILYGNLSIQPKWYRNIVFYKNVHFLFNLKFY